MSVDTLHLTRQFFDAVRVLAFHRGTLQERLADAYADHLLAVSIHDLPEELQAPFRELEQRMNSQEDNPDVDPIESAASQLSDAEARALIERILALYGRVAALAAHTS
jgi:hypothetical protein